MVLLFVKATLFLLVLFLGLSPPLEAALVLVDSLSPPGEIVLKGLMGPIASSLVSIMPSDTS